MAWYIAKRNADTVTYWGFNGWTTSPVQAYSLFDEIAARNYLKVKPQLNKNKDLILVDVQLYFGREGTTFHTKREVPYE